MSTVFRFPKLSELASAARRLGFANPENVAAELAPRLPLSDTTTEQAAGLVREHALRRPDLVNSWQGWAPAELRAHRGALLRGRRVDELRAFEAAHGDKIALAESVVKRERARLEDAIRAEKSSAFSAEQQLGRGLAGRGLRGSLASAKAAAWRISQSGPPEQVAEALARANERVEALEADVAALETIATTSRAEAAKLEGELAAWE